ncbi:unnamed protein product [Chondrus crispus]|uniref:Uncharacterized protein n=1 Tax=Chondrus crispus TaxID=2769 RepID=R7QL04_CHOCR|nr:unnamed protein product [Chondrus crispus]CDF38065.1 unnamed protein product [Chondrus crispus]|eukprot:XP_005717934.1 unnamed protein product [Chondrus crispus]
MHYLNGRELDTIPAKTVVPAIQMERHLSFCMTERFPRISHRAKLR